MYPLNLTSIDAFRNSTGRTSVVQHVGGRQILLGESSKIGRKAAMYEVMRRPSVAKKIEQNERLALARVERVLSNAIMDGSL
jgi:hypothetical protein